MSDGRPTNKHTTNAGNNDGRIRGIISDSDNVKISAKTSSNPFFPETTEFKITKITQEKENRIEKEKED